MGELPTGGLSTWTLRGLNFLASHFRSRQGNQANLRSTKRLFRQGIGSAEARGLPRRLSFLVVISHTLISGPPSASHGNRLDSLTKVRKG